MDAKDGMWMYWVDDGTDGKATNWYPYENKANAQVEELYQNWKDDATFAQRVVKSGRFSYLVDLDSMTQTNISHPNRTVRQLRRQPLNMPRDYSVPPALQS